MRSRWIVSLIMMVIFFNWMTPGLAIMLSIALFWLMQRDAYPKQQSRELPHEAIINLILLRQKLTDMWQADALDDAKYTQLCQQIEQRLKIKTTPFYYDEISLQHKLDHAWELIQDPNQSWQDPPWSEVKPEPKAESLKPEPEPVMIVEPVAEAVVADIVPEIIPEEPKAPSLASRMQGLVKNLLIPLVWQNIGWFIGALMFVSGSIFLVTYTTGFSKALTVLITLSLYASLLFWGAYQMRRAKPDLVNASNMLALIAVLLMPLVMATAARLINIAGTHVGLQLLAIPLSMAIIFAFGYAVNFASALVERRLGYLHARIVMLLSLLQFLIPILVIFPYWPLLAVIHFSLLAILMIAIRTFLTDWLYAIFINQHYNTYYLVGSLLFTSLVSFIHLTLGSSITLPTGYAGPFLMIICLALFYVDLHFKQWVKKSIWLGRFSFVIYGWSVIALLLSWQGQINIFVLLSLCLAAVLYASMVWHYLTLAPLYLLIAALSGLYAYLILRHLPFASYFLSSLPGFILIFGLQQLALKRQSPLLIVTIQRILLMLISGLVIFSLYHGQPSFISMLTPLFATLLLLVVFGARPQQFNIQARSYFIIVLMTLTLFYTPRWFGEWQFIASLMLLGIAWGVMAIYAWRSENSLWSIDALINSSLLSFVFGLMLHHEYLVFGYQLSIIGCFTLWLSLQLRLQRFFYLSLFSLSITGILFKQHYFPGISTGTSKLLLASACAGLWWGLEFYQQKIQQIRQQLQVDNQTHYKTFSLFVYWPADPNYWPNRVEMVLTPIKQATIILWCIGLYNFSMIFFNGFHAPIIPLLLATALGFFISWQSHQRWLLPFALFMMLFSLLEITAIPTPWLAIATIGYSGSLWWLSYYFGLKKSDWNDKKSSHFYVYMTLFSSIVLALLFQIIMTGYHHQLMPLVSALLLAGLFLAMMGYYYQHKLHSYLVCICCAILFLLANYHFLLGMFGFMAALLSLTLFSIHPKLKSLVADPVRYSAIFFTAIAVWHSLGYYFSPWLSPTLLLLILISMVATLGKGNAALLRSFIIPILLTMILIDALGYYQPNYYYALWAFALWFISQKVLPIVNYRWPAWAIAPQSWLWYGLIISIWSLQTFNPGLLFLSIIYMGLMLIRFEHTVFAWLIAAGLTLWGLITIQLTDVMAYRVIGFMSWLNLLLLLTSVWQKYKQKYGQSSRQLLEKPLLIVPLLFISAGLFVLLSHVFLNKIWMTQSILIILGIGLVLSYANLYYLYRVSIYFHAMVMSVVSLVFLLALTADMILMGITVMITAILFVLLQLEKLKQYKHIIYMLDQWLNLLFIATLIAVIIVTNDLVTQFSILSLLVIVCLIQTLITPFNLQITIWRGLGYGLFFIGLHLVWILLFNLTIEQLLPWYSLQSIAILLLNQRKHHQSWLPQRLVSQFNIAPVLIMVAISEWVGHIWILFTQVTIYTQIDHLAAMVALLLILVSQYKPQWQTQTSSIYRLSFIAMIGLLYCRFLVLGLVPFTLWDTVVLLTIGYGLLLLQPKPVISAWYMITLVVPVLALCTVPWQLASVQTTTTLLAASMIYLFMPRKSQQYIPLYLGLLGVNVGIYLWIPQFSNNFHLLQLYTMPAAISVLLMLQLHHLDLTKTTTHSIRLMALVVLYSSATLDVFLRPELGIFMLAIGLSLLGIVMGLSLRIRAFVYSGVGFLLLNIIGQLVQFYPQQSLGKALVLMILGSLITAGMIAFNIKRDVIMQRINLAREDLEQWS